MYSYFLFVCLLTIFELNASQECGISTNGRTLDKPASKRRVYHGDQSRLGDWPWIVYINVGEPDKWQTCTGSIINEKYVLTAAHCFRTSANSANVYTGILDIEKIETAEEDPSTYDGKYKAKSWIKHENFDELWKDGVDSDYSHIQYDIAVIELEEPIIFNDNVKPICLACSFDYEVGTRLVTAGVGSAYDDQAQKQVDNYRLQDVVVSISANHECAEYSNTDNEYAGTNYCVAEQSKTMGGGSGDSGGPNLMFKPASDGKPDRWY